MKDLLTNKGTARRHGHAQEARTRWGDQGTLGRHGYAGETRTRSGDTDTLGRYGHARETRIRWGDTDTLEGHRNARGTRSLHGHGHGTARSLSRHGTVWSRHGRVETRKSCKVGIITVLNWFLRFMRPSEAQKRRIKRDSQQIPRTFLCLRYKRKQFRLFNQASRY